MGKTIRKESRQGRMELKFDEIKEISAVSKAENLACFNRRSTASGNRLEKLTTELKESIELIESQLKSLECLYSDENISCKIINHEIHSLENENLVDNLAKEKNGDFCMKYADILRNLQTIQFANYTLSESLSDLYNIFDSNKSRYQKLQKFNSIKKSGSSEFQSGKYQQLELLRIIEYYLANKIDEHELWYMVFCAGSIGYISNGNNEAGEIASGVGRKQFPLLAGSPINCLNNSYYTCLRHNFEKGFQFESKDDDSIVDVTPYIISLERKSRHFYRVLEDEVKAKATGNINRKKLIPVIAQEYIQAFVDLTKQGVFKPGNRALDSMKFRFDSGFLDELICPTETKCFVSKSPASNMHYYYRFSVENPFVCASAIRVIKSLIEYKKQKIAEDKFLSSLRDSIFKRCVEREFRRYLLINRKTYRLSFNRMMDALVACPYNQVSSIENVKPIRLAEKICVGIHNFLLLNDNKVSKIQISVVGHTDPSMDEQKKQCVEAEFEDLGNAVREWLELNNVNHIDVVINNVYNANDIARVFLEPAKGKSIICSGKKTIQLKYTPTDFNRYAYGTQTFNNEILKESDIIFLLDCPFLTDENYDISTNNSLENYCRSIQNQPAFDGSDVPMGSKKKTQMQILNSQYNRIMASSTRDAGEVCRVFQNYWVKCIRQSVDESKTPKVVYVFSSETDGLSFSTLSAIPTSRIEKYGGKTFNIFRFSNFKGKRLPAICSKQVDTLELRISLWRMLKYISVECAVNDIKKIIQQYFNITKKKLELDPMIPLRLYTGTDIVIREKVPYRVSHIYNLEVSVEINKNHLKNIVDINEVESLEILGEYHKGVQKFIKDIYNNVYFPSSKQECAMFGDDVLREAFAMNLYSAAEDVRGLWFLHQYEKACNEKKNGNSKAFSQFNISVSDRFVWKDPKKQAEDIQDLFMDKKLYRQAMKKLEDTDGFGFNLLALVMEADEYYRDVNWGSGPKILLNNLLEVCRDTDTESSQFCENCRKTFSKL